ncbi:cytochrome P450 [Rhizopogon vinicolor AM-OR11-026]|uniref:Cytochrome P450 n=1 Tax=Rhizopogon vinicolor AM-OR11-026 TaxID=1314800 RepID=A0A1B7N1F6_9AGAM|nr:cytochrome P450 [Rhizopogon vinicolor AM-OR11-026]
MSFAHILAVGISCVALVAALRQTRKRVYPLPLPPGPRPLPFLGNALQLDTKRPWLTYTAWGKTYGNLIYSNVLGIDMIIINSETVARELLGKRSAIYSDRPVIRTNELIGVDFNTGLLPYGETLQQHRKIYHQVLRAEACVSYKEMYSRQANQLVINLLNTTVADDLQKQIQVYSASLIMAVTYGHVAHGDKDPFLARADELFGIVMRLIPAEKAAMFTAFPFLEWLPAWCLGGDYALMGRSRELSQQLFNEPFDEVKAQMVQGTASQSLVADFLSQADDNTDEDTMKAVALTGYLAGMETIASVFHSFVLAMVLYPDVQARARAEINHVVKHDQVPSIGDRASLPYLDAILLEVLRWHPPVPLGIPHATTQDDVYDGYFIPKGSKSNVLRLPALSRDENTFPDASRFDPSRHLTIDGQLKESIVNSFIFGHGRRICPGRWFAENVVWAAMATILSVVHIDHSRDPHGHRIEVKPEYTGGVAM